MRHSHLLGAKEPIFFNIFKTLQEEMSDNYPELNRAQSLIKETLRMEEEKFLVLLERGIKILNDEISKIDKILSGEVAFKLYDTYGFPIDLTEDILKNKSLKFLTTCPCLAYPFQVAFHPFHPFRPFQVAFHLLRQVEVLQILQLQ